VGLLLTERVINMNREKQGSNLKGSGCKHGRETSISKEKLIGSLFLVSLIYLLISQARALEATDCFDYYQFQKGIGFRNFQPEKTSYQSGDNIYFDYQLINRMESPIVEGKERVQILFIKNGSQHIVDEFFVSKDISLGPKEAIDRGFEWEVPENIRDGDYVAKIYLMNGDTFNLAGLSFVPYGPPGVPGDQTFFEINGNDNYFYFDKERTNYNQKSYPFSSFAPQLSPENKTSLETYLVNEGPADNVEVTMEVFPWDSVATEPVESRSEKVLVARDSERKLSYQLPELEPNAYEVVLTAESGSRSALLKMRFGVSGSRARFIYGGLTSFPLKKNSEYTSFLCVSNAADHVHTFQGNIQLEFRDESGNMIFSDQKKNITITPTPMGFRTNFTPATTSTQGVLSLKLTNLESKTVDATNLTYSYSDFPYLDSELSLELEETEVSQGETFDYSLNYRDEEGRPLQGKVLLYVTDAQGNVKYAQDGIRIEGSKTGSLTAAFEPGNYKVKVRELTHDLKTVKSIKITEGERGSEEESVQNLPDKGGKGKKESDNSLMIYSLVVILAILVLGVIYKTTVAS